MPVLRRLLVRRRVRRERVVAGDREQELDEAKEAAQPAVAAAVSRPVVRRRLHRRRRRRSVEGHRPLPVT